MESSALTLPMEIVGVERIDGYYHVVCALLEVLDRANEEEGLTFPRIKWWRSRRVTIPLIFQHVIPMVGHQRDDHLTRGDTWDQRPKRHGTTEPSPSISTMNPRTFSSFTMARRSSSSFWPSSSRWAYNLPINRPAVAVDVRPATPIMHEFGSVASSSGAFSARGVRRYSRSCPTLFCAIAA